MATTQAKHQSYAFIAKATMAVIAVWALANALWLARDIAFIAFDAILLALFLSIFVDRLETVMPRTVAVLLVVLGFAALLAGFVALTWPSLENQIATIRADVPRTVNEVIEWIRSQYRALVPVPSPSGPPESEATPETQARLATELSNIVGGALPLLNTALGAMTGTLVVIFAGIFLAVNPGTYTEGFVRLIPEKGRARVRDALLETGAALKRWMAGMSVSMVVIFVATTAGLYLLGVPAPLALGIIAGLLVFIPFVGPILSAIPAIALALTVSPTMALWVALFYFGVQLLESNALMPLVMREAVSLQPAITILFQMAMGVLFGFLGLLLAVPLLAAIRVLLERLYIDRLDRRSPA